MSYCLASAHRLGRYAMLLPLALALVLAACGSPKKPEQGIAASSHPHAHAQVYRLDAQQSSIVLRVYRDGPLARFGHNHTIAVAGLAGTVWRERDFAHSGFELRIPVLQLAVDRPADRAAAGADFPGELSPFAIAGTRENMLGPKLLAAEQYPEIRLESVALDGSPPDLRFTVKVTVRGIDSQIVVPATVRLSDSLIVAEGRVALLQTQLGLAPFSVLGGGLRVRDGIDADFRLVAVRGE